MKRSIHIKDTLLDLTTPVVMGILNVTPDSFSDGGHYTNIDVALRHAQKMINDGAGIIDIGGYSSRPGADDVSVQEELDRTIPIIERLSKRIHVPISIDTYRSSVALAAIQAGASIVNDISAGEADENMIPEIGKLKVPYIAMHRQGESKTMQDNPTYYNVVEEVCLYLRNKKEECKLAGIEDLIIDPGFGFGKTIEHNYELMKGLNQFTDLGIPLLVGISRKSMIHKVLNIEASEALNGTTFLHAFSLQGGANILRVHDVQEAMECVKLWQAMKD